MTIDDVAPPVQRSESASTDVAEVEALLSQGFADDLTVAASPDAPFGFEQQVAFDGTATVSTMRFSGRVRAETTGSRQVLFTDVADGRYGWRSGEQRGDQDRPLILPADHHLAVEFESVRSVMIGVDAPTVGRWLARFGGLPPAPALLHRAVAGSEAVRQAVRFYGGVMPTAAFDSELVRAGLLDVLLSTTAHHLMPDASTGGARPAPAALVRAQQYLRDHAGEAVSIADAAEAARLSIRGLHEQFRRWLHVTPAQYLRNVRLDRVRAELIAARDGGRPVTVAEVARRWGFAHVGRFSGTYAEAFGELPSTTLRG